MFSGTRSKTLNIVTEILQKVADMYLCPPLSCARQDRTIADNTESTILFPLRSPPHLTQSSHVRYRLPLLCFSWTSTDSDVVSAAATATRPLTRSHTDVYHWDENSRQRLLQDTTRLIFQSKVRLAQRRALIGRSHQDDRSD